MEGTRLPACFGSIEPPKKLVSNLELLWSIVNLHIDIDCRSCVVSHYSSFFAFSFDVAA